MVVVVVVVVVVGGRAKRFNLFSACAPPALGSISNRKVASNA